MSQPAYPPSGAYPAPAPRPASSGRGLAIVAVVVGAIPVLFGAVWPVLTVQLYRAAPTPDLLGLFTGGIALVECVLGALAVILGAVAVRRSPASRLLGGIAIGLGGATVVGTVLGFLSSAASSALY